MQLPPARDLLASFVVFLVALPLCMGVAIASGAPPALGLLTGIVAGLVVGVAAGSPLQVSGPAAGLAVIVWELIQQWGIGALGLVVGLAGLMQLVAGLSKLGRLFRAVSPAVIHGMLAGIGVLIFGSQFHVMLDQAPPGNGLANLVAIPGALMDAAIPPDFSQHQQAALVGLVTIVAIVAWTALRPKRLKAVPGALIGVGLGTLLAVGLGLEVSYVSVPDSLSGALNTPTLETFGLLGQPAFWGSAAALAAVASAEGLLCATATDQLHDGVRTDYDRELAAQGLGNLVCGALGALPLTGVIVRSSANVDAGATTRWSATLHGAWLLGLIVLLPGLLGLIPVASLAAVLVYIGFRLVKPAQIAELKRFGLGEVGIYAATVGTIVAVDLLTGVLVGVGLAVARLVWQTARLEVTVTEDKETDELVVALDGNASFVTLPNLAEALEALPPGRVVRVELHDLQHLDHASIDLIERWADQYARRGGDVHGWPVPHLHPALEAKADDDTDDTDAEAAK